jgi:hypothetical protein
MTGLGDLDLKKTNFFLELMPDVSSFLFRRAHGDYPSKLVFKTTFNGLYFKSGGRIPVGERGKVPVRTLERGSIAQ